MTENTTRTTTDRTMNDVSHTHPDTDRPFGDAVVYQRGPAVAADGGEREPRRSAERSDGGARDDSEETATTDMDADADEPVDGERMKDVDHEPPTEAEPNRVFERGTEGRDETR